MQLTFFCVIYSNSGGQNFQETFLQLSDNFLPAIDKYSKLLYNMDINTKLFSR